jgi:hypothetical protein
MACDDGDIIAYYTHQLNDEINRNLTVRRGLISETAPLFHENVGISAVSNFSGHLISLFGQIREFYYPFQCLGRFETLNTPGLQKSFLIWQC